MYRAIGKRVLDLLLLAFSAPFALPILAILSFLVRWRMGAPVFMIQKRTGLNGRPFSLIKFRTMTDERDATGRLLSDEQRLTAFGKNLRNASLDELPELWNVLRGDMSFVGPRPLLLRYLERYNEHQLRRHDVLPGITGLAQVNGRNTLSWEARFDLDVWYVDHLSAWLDLTILWKTLGEVIFRRGVSHPGTASMHEFEGSAGSAPSKPSGR